MKTLVVGILLSGAGFLGQSTLPLYVNRSEALVSYLNTTPSSFIEIKLFEAVRTKTKVDLLWETDKEWNGGYEIQRKTANGDWEKVAKVYSQNINEHNSSVVYEYTDINTSLETTYYRLRQIDNEKNNYSKVIMVFGRK